MRKALFFIIANSLFHIANCQSQYWQQQVNYIIDVSLNDKEKTLDGFEKLTYFNNSPDTLHYIWFHLWPNAYKNDQTAFSDQLLENGNTKFYFSNKDQKGYINRLDFKVNDVAAKTEDHPQHIDIIKLLLPTPLAPRQQIIITTPFHVKLPFNFSRGGYDKESFQLTQWYPKPAVYNEKGWHPMPYLDQGEFYSEFGNYDVRITVPNDYVVAATGELQNEEEKEWLESKKVNSLPVKKPAIKKSQTPVKKKALNTDLTPIIKIKTLQYLQNNIHDFAIFANKDFIVEKDTCQLPSGKIIEVQTYYTPQYEKNWKQSLQYVKDAVKFYSAEVGEYPYNTISAVQGPQSFGGAMEYPTITVLSPSISGKELDRTITHEVGHNWFYGTLASNEREHPWMDEGINSFYENKYMERKYGSQAKQQEIAFQTQAKKHLDQPMETAATTFTKNNYGLVAYHKTAQWLKAIEDKLGSEKFREMMQKYFSTWSFKHPQPKDFKNILESHLQNDASAFEQLTKKGILPGQQLSGVKLITLFQPKSFKEYLSNPTKDALIISPAIGYNTYDKFMIGGLFSNYKLPPSAFQFIAVPLYGTGSKKMNGIGKLSYTAYPIKGQLQKAEVFINASKFSMSDFTDSKDNRFVFGFHKFAPGVELSFKEKDIKSTTHKHIQWKSFFIKEEPLRISFDTLINANDTTITDVVTKGSLNFSIH
ncbi:MAG: M1 family metallopeptidase, partial [Bacteroidota bacterium]|nr:M1 family metallopeptidase [Bacteroidota bacterium]